MSEIIDVPMHAQRDIRDVTVEIRQLHRQGQELALMYIVEIGRRLTEAKAMLPHGEWGQWVKEELPFSQRTAGNFMLIFEKYGADQASLFGEVKSQALANLSYTKALRLLAIDDEEEREAFVEQHDVENMSTRELEKTIRERDEAKREAEEAKREAEELARRIRDADGAVADAERARDELEEKLKKAEADSGSYFHGQQEAVKKAEELRKKLQAAQDGMAKEREAAKKAREDLKALQEKPVQVPQEELEKIRAQEEARAEAAVKAAEEKAETLRRQLAAADPDTAVFSTHFRAVQREFEELGDVYFRVRLQDAERAAKLKTAVRTVVDRLAGEIEERW